MGIISDALKKAGQERRRRPGRRERFGHDEPIVDLPTFGGLLGEDAEGAGSGEDRARAIMAGMPGLDERVVAVYQSEGVEAEQFRSLRTRLLNQNPDNEHRIIAVTSSTPREGKSITTINLAFALSEVKHLRILVVDGDVRRGCLSEMLNVSPQLGLADMIRNGTCPRATPRTRTPPRF